MDLYLDSEPFESDATTLGELLDAAKDAAPDHRVVVEIRLDGRTLAASDLDAMHDRALDAEEVQFITADPRELAVATLTQVRAALDEAVAAQQNAADLLRSDDATQAMEQVKDVLNLWQQTQQAVLHSAQLLDVPLDDLTVDGQPVAEVINDLVANLGELREQLTNGDWLGLADTLGYPLAESVETWQRLIDELCAKIEAGD